MTTWGFYIPLSTMLSLTTGWTKGIQSCKKILGLIANLLLEIEEIPFLSLISGFWPPSVILCSLRARFGIDLVAVTFEVVTPLHLWILATFCNTVFSESKVWDWFSGFFNWSCHWVCILYIIQDGMYMKWKTWAAFKLFSERKVKT